jgi:hypothetical protein
VLTSDVDRYFEQEQQQAAAGIIQQHNQAILGQNNPGGIRIGGNSLEEAAKFLGQMAAGTVASVARNAQQQQHMTTINGMRTL